MLCLFSIYLLNCLLTKDATIIYAHSVRKESKAQTGQVPQREWRSHNFGSDTRAGGLITQLCQPGWSAEAVLKGLWSGETGYRPCPGSNPMFSFYWHILPTEFSAWPPPRSTAMSKRCRLGGCHNSFGDWKLWYTWNIALVPTGQHFSWRSSH